MTKREVFVDPSNVEKLSDGNFKSKYLDIGDQKELKALLREQTDKSNELLMKIYNTAEEILSVSQYKVFEAVFKHGYKIPMLSRKHNISRSTYYTHFYRALRKLKKVLVDGGDVKKRKAGSKRKGNINKRDWGNPFNFEK